MYIHFSPLVLYILLSDFIARLLDDISSNVLLCLLSRLSPYIDSSIYCIKCPCISHIRKIFMPYFEGLLGVYCPNLLLNYAQHELLNW